jgi:hypothetical protein
MTDPFERQLRERLHWLDLPAAPTTLHAEVARLRASDPPAPQSRSFGRWQLLLVAAVAVGLAAASLALVGASRPSPTPVVPSFTAPGISFAIPKGWSDQTAAVDPALNQPLGQRFVGVLARNLTLCPMDSDGAWATPSPSGCETEATKPGSALLYVIDFTNPLPRDFPGDLNGYPASESTGSTQWAWFAEAPDGGLYAMQLYAPSSEIAHEADVVRTALSTLRLTPWGSPPVVANGLIHEDTGAGFSFDYPAGWVLYYPHDISMMDSAVVTIASRPLLPPSSDSNQTFMSPGDAIVIEFREGNGPVAPDWTTAPATVGGQPALRWDDGPSSTPGNRSSITESHHWEVRLPPGPAQLGIYVSMSGSDLEPWRSAMDQVLASVEIAPEPSATP